VLGVVVDRDGLVLRSKSNHRPLTPTSITDAQMGQPASGSVITVDDIVVNHVAL